MIRAGATFQTFSLSIAQLLVASTIAHAAAPAPMTPFGEPNGFSLESSKVDAHGNPVFYGSTNGSDLGNWHFTQWNSRADMAPLSNKQTAANTLRNEWSSANATQAVHAVKNNDGTWAETIAQSNIPCLDAHNQTNESDLFIEPNANQITSPTLNNLTSFKASGKYTLNNVAATPGMITCHVNQGHAVYGIILNNTVAKPRQMLWYALWISFACIPGAQDAGFAAGFPGSDYYWCLQAQKSKVPSWFWTGSDKQSPYVQTDASGAPQIVNFGVDDVMSSFGSKPIQDHRTHALNFSFLDRMKTLIASGAYGMDKDVSHWTITGANFGQDNWGGASMSTTWQGFSPTWTVNLSGSVKTCSAQRCDATISWQSASDTAQVWVQMDGQGARTQFACGNQGVQSADWIKPGHSYTFSLYEHATSCAATAPAGAATNTIVVTGAVTK